VSPIIKRVFSLFLAIGLVATMAAFALRRTSSCIPDCSSLHQAAHRGDIPVIQDFLASGESINARATNGWTPLHYAAAAGHLNVATYLLDHGAEINAGMKECEQTPLFSAVAARNPSAATAMTNLLIQRGANPNATIAGDQTPLMVAVARCRADAAKLLLDAGAHIDALDEEGATALNLSRKVPIVELLVQRGANIDHLSGDGRTPLMKAASAGDCRLVTYFLCEGADPDIANHHGWTALHHAAANGHTECAELILIAGADPMPKNAEGATPLSLASDEVTARAISNRGGGA